VKISPQIAPGTLVVSLFRDVARVVTERSQRVKRYVGVLRVDRGDTRQQEVDHVDRSEITDLESSQNLLGAQKRNLGTGWMWIVHGPTLGARERATGGRLTLVETPSTASLSTKLGVKNGSTLMLLHAPTSLDWEVDPSVSVKHTRRGNADVVVAFYVKSSLVSPEIESLSRLIFPSDSLWLAWPKRSSGVTTDLSDHVLRDVALPRGLVDNKVCSIDATWTAMRFVWRLERRTLSN
jgi:hypothetical protein